MCVQPLINSLNAVYAIRNSNEGAGPVTGGEHIDGQARFWASRVSIPPRNLMLFVLPSIPAHVHGLGLALVARRCHHRRATLQLGLGAVGRKRHRAAVLALLLPQAGTPWSSPSPYGPPIDVELIVFI